MFGFFQGQSWPQFSADDIRRRSRLLVIDDGEFPYQALFKRDGYAIEKWNDVKNLSTLERGEFDVILLDIHGVGRKESNEQGFGILKHLRVRAPAQIVVAYSNADWSLKYQEFFDLADAKLDKRADYVDFKRIVDEQLRRRFSIEFYLDRIVQAAGANFTDPSRLRKVATKAILSRNPKKLEEYLKKTVDTEGLIQIGLGIAQVAIGIISLGKI